MRRGYIAGRSFLYDIYLSFVNIEVLWKEKGNMGGRKWTRIAVNRRMERSEEGLIVCIYSCLYR